MAAVQGVARAHAPAPPLWLANSPLAAGCNAQEEAQQMVASASGDVLLRLVLGTLPRTGTACGGAGEGAPGAGAGCGAAAAARAARDAPGARAPGRPPKEDGAYSREYVRLRNYRQRKKAAAADLESVLSAQLAKLRTLEQENHTLKVRAHVLQQAVTARCSPTLDEACGQEGAAAVEQQAPSTPGVQAAPGPPRWAAPTPAPSGTAPALTPRQDHAAAMRQSFTCVAAAAQRAPAFPLIAQALRCMHAQLMRSGGAAGIAAQDAAEAQGGAGARAGVTLDGMQVYTSGASGGSGGGGGTRSPLMQLFMSLSPQEVAILLMTNMETGELNLDVPESLWQHVADQFDLSPAQEAQMRPPLQRMEADLAALLERRRKLLAELDAVLCAANAAAGPAPGPPPAGGGGVGGGGGPATRSAGGAAARAAGGGGLRRWRGARTAGGQGQQAGGGGAQAGPAAAPNLMAAEELVEALRANLVVEDSMWTTLSWTLRLMLDRYQMAACLEHSWPYWPRVAVILKAKLSGTRAPQGTAPRGARPRAGAAGH